MLQPLSMYIKLENSHSNLPSTDCSLPSRSYLQSINRILDGDFVPSFEDAAMSLIDRSRRADVLTLPLSTSHLRYSFVQWTPPFSSEELEGLDYLWFMADITLISTDPDKLNETLESFRCLFEFKWLASKDIMLVFQNHALRHKQDDDYMKSMNNILDQFCSLNEDKSREIFTVFARDDNSAFNLAYLQEVVQYGFLNRRKG